MTLQDIVSPSVELLHCVTLTPLCVLAAYDMSYATEALSQTGAEITVAAQTFERALEFASVDSERSAEFRQFLSNEAKGAAHKMQDPAEKERLKQKSGSVRSGRPAGSAKNSSHCNVTNTELLSPSMRPVNACARSC